MDDPYHIGENGQPEEIEGEEDDVADLEAVYTPFSIYHTKGSVSQIFFLPIGLSLPILSITIEYN